MGLQVSNVNVKTTSGDNLTSFWLEVKTVLAEKPVTGIIVELIAFRTEADRNSGYSSISFINTGAGLASDVPGFLRYITDSITAGQYANLDMLQIHNLVRDLLIEGDANARWADLAEPGEVWAGFGAGNVVTDMPV